MDYIRIFKIRIIVSLSNLCGCALVLFLFEILLCSIKLSWINYFDDFVYIYHMGH